MSFKQFYENTSYEDKLKDKYKINKVESGSIGYSDTNKKWYGWSHRAIYGFGVGSKCKIGDCAYKPSNKEEFLESLKTQMNDGYYKNIEYNMMKHGIKVNYEIHKNNGEVCKTNRIHRYPKYWGKGQWEAKSLDDAKIMAKDFAESVS